MEYKCIWVKYGGWPLWPCRFAALCEVGPKLASGKENEEQVLVKFFGTPDEYAWVPKNQAKKFTLESINTLNPLFHSMSERKLYERAIKEVISWHKTKEEERIIPVWKPGDEDTQGNTNADDSDDGSNDEGSAVYEDWDYVDVGSSEMIESVESTLEPWEEAHKTIKKPPKKQDHSGAKLKFMSGDKRHEDKEKREKKHDRDERKENEKHEKNEKRETSNKNEKREAHRDRKDDTKRAAHTEADKHSKRNDISEEVNARDPPNRIITIPAKKRPLDLVGAGSPKKYKYNTESSNNNNNTATKINNNNNNKNKSIIKDERNEESTVEHKISSNKSTALITKQQDDKHNFREQTTHNDITRTSPSLSPGLLPSPSSPPPSPPSSPPKQLDQGMLLRINNSDSDYELKSDGETRKQSHKTEKPTTEMRKSVKDIKNHNKPPKHTGNGNGDVYVPDTQTQVALEDLVREEVSKEREQFKKIFSEQIDRLQKSFDSRLTEMAGRIVEDNLQGKADKLWDQQTTFEEKMKNYIKNEVVGVRKEISNMQNELDKALQSLEQHKKNTTQTLIALLKESIVKLEQSL